MGCSIVRRNLDSEFSLYVKPQESGVLLVSFVVYRTRVLGSILREELFDKLKLQINYASYILCHFTLA
jgi:hypothetical protein